MISDWSGIVAALIAGLLGSVHCFGMCGGIAGALQLAIPKTPGATLKYLLSYNLGRITGYSLLGLIAGIFSITAAKAFALEAGFNILRIVGAIFLMLMAAYIGRWWMVLTHFERLAQKIFNPIRKIGKRWLPLKNPLDAAILGVFWGFLPCGLVYSALVFSASAPSISEAVIRMAAFGLGTLPAVGVMGGVASGLKIWLQQPTVKQFAAISLLIVAIWTAYPAVMQMMMSNGVHQHH